MPRTKGSKNRITASLSLLCVVARKLLTCFAV